MSRSATPIAAGVTALAALVALWPVAPAAQIGVDRGAMALDVEWAPRVHEDQPDRGGGPELGDYQGLPINDAARLRAQSWDAGWHTMPEWQCRPHTAEYIWRGPSNLRIWREVDPITRNQWAFRVTFYRSPERYVYTDGRPHPPEWAAHSYPGFSTGKWNGDTFSVTTTHMKEGFLRRNGVPRSSKATLVQHWIRNDNYLTAVMITYDPVYLEEPLIRSSDYEMDPRQYLQPYPCAPRDEVVRPFGQVPHYLPGANPYLREYADKFKIPDIAIRGGAETIYPEFRAKLQQANAAPAGLTPAAALNKPLALSRPAGVQTWPVRDHIHLIVGAGGNITASVGPDGVLLVDAGNAAQSDEVLAAVRRLSDKPIFWILNTSMDADHTGGNDKVAKAGMTYRGFTGGDVGDENEGAQTVAHENALKRMSAPTGVQSRFPFATWPKDTYVSDQTALLRWFNGEGIRMVHGGAAHTDGDTVVHFRKADVIAAGDVFVTDSYPVIDAASGGSIQGLIAAVNNVLRMSVQDFMGEGGTLIVPGHGRVADAADLAYYRDMLTIIRDRVQDMVKRGMTLEQVRAARPTRDYDGHRGATQGAWTTDMFVEAVYRGLTPGATR
jgi:glyoxylase-like metal-dependent hydrolase (beta-lactamase superfamily II)